MKKHNTFITVYNEFYLKYNESENLEEISKAWKKCFYSVLKNEFGFNKNARKTCFDWGNDGFNWTELHAKEDKTYTDYKSEFFGEVSYCSDRMDFNRLLRCHHLFRLTQSKHDTELDTANSK